MSHTGKLIRGLKWYMLRNSDGELPKGISEDPAKMQDVDYYTDFIKDKDEKAVRKVLINLRHVQRSTMKNRKMMIQQAKDVLNSDEILEKKKTNQTTEPISEPEVK